MYEIGVNFANVDITREPIPVVPTIHYQMGGIRPTSNGQVVDAKDGEDNAVNGLYAVGECACVSVHGANRLGTNSLLDLLVFGARANHIVELPAAASPTNRCPPTRPTAPGAPGTAWTATTSGEYAQDVANDIRATMQQHAGVFRTQASMDEGARRWPPCANASAPSAWPTSRGVQHRPHRGAGGGNLIEAAQATMVSAAARGMPWRHTVKRLRTPRRRPQAPLGRDDANWMKHTCGTAPATA